ncbi:MAG: flavin reductase [Treponema sp.]|nr:flavin reductase [Treponema sp.]
MKQKDVIAADNSWKKITASEFSGSPFERIGRDWMMITAGDVSGDKGNWNTMTASWGGLGVLWGRNVATVYIRPSRCTFGIINNVSLFTLSFFDESKRDALNICGSKSGRDIDKAAEAGLTPIVFDDVPSVTGAGSAVSFREAKEILICRKLYTHDIDPGRFLDPGIEKNYHGHDYHRMFIGEIICIKSGRNA